MPGPITTPLRPRPGPETAWTDERQLGVHTAISGQDARQSGADVWSSGRHGMSSAMADIAPRAMASAPETAEIGPRTSPITTSIRRA